MKLLLVIIEGQLYLAGVLAIFVAETRVSPVGSLVPSAHHRPDRRVRDGAVDADHAQRDPRVFLQNWRARRSAARPTPKAARSTRSSKTSGARSMRRRVDGIIITWRLQRRRSHAHRHRGGSAVIARWCSDCPCSTTLSVAELRAVIAHELAHFSSGARSVCGVGLPDAPQLVCARAVAGPKAGDPSYVYWLIRWYVPRLHAASAAVVRRHEFVADRVAANVAGSRAAADALVVLEAGARFADDTYWPAIRDQP